MLLRWQVDDLQEEARNNINDENQVLRETILRLEQELRDCEYFYRLFLSRGNAALINEDSDYYDLGLG